MYALKASIFEIFAKNKKAIFREFSAHWFLANISKIELRRAYIASQVQYKCENVMFAVILSPNLALYDLPTLRYGLQHS